MWSFIFPASDYRTFRRSAAQSEGLVINRYIEERTYWEDGHQEVERYYHLVFEYDIKVSETATEKNILDALVKPAFYKRHEIGTKVLVHYAREDPRLAYLDGEMILFGRPKKDLIDWK